MDLVQELLQKLPPELARLCTPIEHDSGSFLFLTGERPNWMFVVLQGEVILERHAEHGQCICLQRCHSGLVAEASLTARRYHCDARIGRPTRLIRLPIEALRHHLLADPDFALRWIEMLSQEIRRLRLQNERLSLPRVQDRLLHLIATEGQDGRYELSCSLKQLAQQLGVTHEALYRALSTLEAQGRIGRDAQGLRLVAS